MRSETTETPLASVPNAKNAASKVTPSGRVIVRVADAGSVVGFKLLCLKSVVQEIDARLNVWSKVCSQLESSKHLPRSDCARAFADEQHKG